MWLLGLLVGLLFAVATGQEPIYSPGTKLTVDDANYFVSSLVAGHLPDDCGLWTASSERPGEYVAATVVEAEEALDSSGLQAIISTYLQNDDVFTERFLTCM